MQFEISSWPETYMNQNYTQIDFCAIMKHFLLHRYIFVQKQNKGDKRKIEKMT